MKRPTTDGHYGSTVTTPRAAAMMQLLGGSTFRSVALTGDEFQSIRRLYSFQAERPNKKPDPPKAPDPADFPDRWKYDQAQRQYEAAVKAHANWTDPLPLMQAGADRNAIRHAEADAMRLLAWIAKFVPRGEDPLKHLVQLASDAGWDVDPEDLAWAESGDEFQEAAEDVEGA